MFDQAPDFVGNGHYCYANGTAMLLAACGEPVSPGLVEVLTAMSLGAGWNERLDLIFFDSSPPDVGVSRALGLLGFAASEHASADGEPAPLAALAEALLDGPALLGPLDLGLLRYRPGSTGRPSGVDHYVLAYAVAGDEVYLHDPAGFPAVSLRLAELEAAWAAEQVGYRRGAFRWWHGPRRVRRPSDDQLFRSAVAAFAEVYRGADRAAEAGRIVGRAAIRRLAARVRAGELPPALAGHLRAFALQVGARRALDFAHFFGERAPDLARLKREQAGLFGRSHTLLVRGDHEAAADALAALADVEQAVRDGVLAAAPPA